MRTFQSVLTALRKHASTLPEPWCDCFSVADPVEFRWPAGLPSHPLLEEFYSACDGCDLMVASFLPHGELAEETEGTAEWMGDEDELTPGRWVMLGYNEHSHRLIWDAARDAVLLYDTDGGSLWDADDVELAYDETATAPTGKVTLAKYFERLLHPAADSEDEATREWAKAIEHCEKLG